MTAREWLERTFPVDGTDAVVSDPGDFRHYPIPGVNPSKMARAPMTVQIDSFLTWFGPAIETALASGRSIYAALTDGTVQDRGWRPYFELWKAKGIID